MRMTSHWSAIFVSEKNVNSKCFMALPKDHNGNVIFFFRLPDDDALVVLVSLHIVVAVVGDGENVRRHLTDPLVLVGLDLLGTVDWQHLIGVDGHQDGPRVCLPFRYMPLHSVTTCYSITVTMLSSIKSSALMH